MENNVNVNRCIIFSSETRIFTEKPIWRKFTEKVRSIFVPLKAINNRNVPMINERFSLAIYPKLIGFKTVYSTWTIKMIKNMEK